MDVPPLPPADTGDPTGHHSPPPRPRHPLPPRFTSTPPPPRKNALGLPPSYYAHLRGLLRQWLEQQQRSDEGLPKGTCHDDDRLWNDEKLREIEKAIWDGAVVPQKDSDGRKGLLELDWSFWAVGAAKRRRLWKASLAKDATRAKKASKSEVIQSAPENEPSRGRLVPPSPSAVTTSTPKKSPTRAPSVKSLEPPASREPRSASTSPGQEMKDPEEERRQFYQLLAQLKGFRALSRTRREDWEVIEDVPQSESTDPAVPGAFPQSANYDHIHYRSGSSTTRQPPKLPDATYHPGENDLLKPLFCLQFPGSLPSGSSSTLQLRRQISSSSNGMDNNRWWAGTGSGRGWSGLNFGFGRDVGEVLEVEFVQGSFALPALTSTPTSPKRCRRRSSIRSRRPSLKGSESSGEDDNVSTTSSTTQQTGSRFKSSTVNVIVSGGENDIPKNETDQVGVVGGTVIIRGVRGDEEQQALQKVLHVLLYTIQVMKLELELLDAFRAPREPDPLPVPPKSTSRQTSLQYDRTTDLKRNLSRKERGDRARGFFQRLSKDTRGMFEGLTGKKQGSPEVPQTLLHQTAEALLTPVKTMTSAPDTPYSETAVGTPPVSQPIDRHLQTLARLEKLLPSTTPDLRIPLPSLLIRVREEDRVRNEKARQEVFEDGLPGSGTATPDMSGRARGYRMGGDVRAGLGALTGGMDSFGGWKRLQKMEVLSSSGLEAQSESTGKLTMCERPKPCTFVFWDVEFDESIEEFLAAAAEDETICGRPGCEVDVEGHTRWWYHAGKKVGLRVVKVDTEESDMDAWVECRECGKISDAGKLSYAARKHVHVFRTFSWGKLLEILVYTNILLPSNLCRHCPEPSSQPGDIPPPLFRCIRYRSAVISLIVDSVSVIDTRLPKLQVGPNVAKRKTGKAGAVGAVGGLLKKDVQEKEVAQVNKEIEQVFTFFKDNVESVRASSPTKPLTPPSKAEKEDEPPDVDSSSSASDLMGTGLASIQHADFLDTLLADIELSHESINMALATSPIAQLNDIRRQLIQSYQSIQAKLDAWQKKREIKVDSRDKSVELPIYLTDKKVHVLPGSMVMVREEEPSSIIAYTLSSIVYFTELTGNGKAANEETKTASDAASEVSQQTQDTWSIGIKRKDAPRDLLSLRSITKKRSDASMMKNENKLPLSLPPNQPSLELSLEQVEGKSQASDRLGDLVRTISKATAQDPGVLTAKTRSSSMSESDSGSIATSHPRENPPQMMRRISDSNHRAPPSAFRPTRSVSHTVPSSPIIPSSSSGNVSGTLTSRSTTPTNARETTLTETAREGWSSSVTSTFANSFGNLMRIGSEMGSFRGKPGERSFTSLIGPLSIMSSMDNSLTSPVIDDRPHIQFTYTLGDRLRLSCTVYYATAFDSLRRRCAIDISLIESLSRCEIWETSGGKSKASFFMTRDKRYIVKELVRKWNVSDTHALLEIAPAYFEHLANTHNKATALAKIVGFFTVKMHDLQTSARKQLDLLVMENLFYNQTISRTYDLKGIEGRKVPSSKMGDGTLFDSEWIEGQTREPILLHPHAKRILQDAISNDTRFLSSQSIMDYSLLLGIDQTRREMVVGLVDAIGSYNLFKTIESRGKLALTRGGEVTIIPPDQYRERFEHALKHYFVACPDKWSKPSRRSRPTLDGDLPSVF